MEYGWGVRSTQAYAIWGRVHMKGLEGKARRRLPGERFLKKGLIAAVFCMIAGIFALSVPWTARLMFDDLQTFPPLAPSSLAKTTAGPPMAIVILAAGQRTHADEFGGAFDNEALDGLSLERVRYGAFLARKTGLPILVSGGLPLPGAVSLADLMARTLQIDYGISPKWLEGQSINTAENASLSANILRRAGIGRIMLVTHAWHMKRAFAAFAANGLAVTPAPTVFYFPGRDPGNAWIPTLGTLRMSGYAIHEIVGRVWYRVRYGY
jgi:uncharacterized SAM-binding protein YcdF (DUF218 family)